MAGHRRHRPRSSRSWSSSAAARARAPWSRWQTAARGVAIALGCGRERGADTMLPRRPSLQGWNDPSECLGGHRSAPAGRAAGDPHIWIPPHKREGGAFAFLNLGTSVLGIRRTLVKVPSSIWTSPAKRNAAAIIKKRKQETKPWITHLDTKSASSRPEPRSLNLASTPERHDQGQRSGKHVA